MKKFACVFLAVCCLFAAGCRRTIVVDYPTSPPEETVDSGTTAPAKTIAPEATEEQKGYETVTAGAEDPVAVVYLQYDNAAVINTRGQYTLAPDRFSAITSFIDGKAFAITVPDTNYKISYCVIDKNGNILKTLDGSLFYASKAAQWLIEYYSEGITAIAGKNNLYGFVNTQGQVILQPEYEDIMPFSNGLAAVRKNISSPWQYIDATGKVVITLETYSTCQPFSDGLAYFSLNNPVKMGYMDTAGKAAFYYTSDPDMQVNQHDGFFQYCGDFSEDVVPAQVEWWTYDAAFGDYTQNIALGILNKKGNIVYKDTEEDYKKWLRTMGGNFSEGLLAVNTDDGFSMTACGFIDKKGARTIPLQSKWQPIGYSQQYETTPENLVKYIAFKEGLCPVVPFGQTDGQVGFIDIHGNVVLDYQFAAVKEFSGGLAAVAVKDTYGNRQWKYIDQSGKTIIAGGKDETGKAVTFSNAYTFTE